MYNSRTKYRKIRIISNKILNILRFKLESFSFSKIVILVWVVLSYLSLFLTWISSNNEELQSNIFNKITFNSSIIIIIISSIILFLLFSYNKKEKIKKSTNIIFRDYIIISFLSIIMFLLSINNLWVIIWLKTFSSEITYWNWIIINIIASIFLLVWAILSKNDQYSKNNIYINDSLEEESNKIENNTKLPF